MNDQLQTILQQNIAALTKELSRFDDDAFNRVPASGGWTPGQITEHLLAVEQRTLKVFSGKTETAEPGRGPLAHLEAIKARLTDRVNKIDAPAALVPTDTAKDKETSIQQLVAARNEVIQWVTEHDTSLLLPDLPHRLFGVLTGAEWAYFTVLHTERHIEQLQEISC